MRLARPRRLLAARILSAVAIAFAAGDCSLNVGVDGPTVIVRYGGDNQIAPTNTQLTNPLTVLVTNQFGHSVRNVAVTWTIVSGGGSLSETSNTTADGGLASVAYTTGSTAGTASIQARVSGIPPVTFTVTIT